MCSDIELAYGGREEISKASEAGSLTDLLQFENSILMRPTCGSADGPQVPEQWWANQRRRWGTLVRGKPRETDRSG